MRAPVFQLNEWSVKYRQVPYDDRYFIICYNRREISKIPHFVFQELQCTSLPLDLHHQIDGKEKRFLKFMKKVELYNSFLDKSNV